MATTPVCKHCRTRHATEGVYCVDCLLEVVHDVVDGDITAACERRVIDKEDFSSGGACRNFTLASIPSSVITSAPIFGPSR